MNRYAPTATVALAFSLLAAAPAKLPPPGPVQAAMVTLLRVPNGGIQPQAVVDGNKVIHLVYFSGDPLHGDLFYVHTLDGASFSSPIRVNSQPGSAIAVGNIRGARIAVGTNGLPHVAWNGSSSAEPKTQDGKAPMLYARLNPSSRSFEPQRSLIHFASGIDGGGAIAADRAGNVYVFWHAPLPGGKAEGDRRVWLARSTDNGKTFERERLASGQPAGVCGCCGMSAFADTRGSVFALFRSASETVDRDMYLLSSHDRGQTFQPELVSKWKVGYCVMSTAAFSQNDAGPLAAWETEKQVYYAPIDPATLKILNPVPAQGTGIDRKYPALAVNRQGVTLLAWTEGMGWKKGGSLAWQTFDSAGRPLGAPGHADGVPMWGLVAAFSLPDDTFRLIY